MRDQTLRKARLGSKGRQGKGKTIATEEAGAQICRRYREIRNRFLLDPLDELGIEAEPVLRLGRLLRHLAGRCNQAARAAGAY